MSVPRVPRARPDPAPSAKNVPNGTFLVSALQGVVNKLRILIPRLDSGYDGEVVATVRQIQKVLNSAGLNLHDLSDAIAKPVIVHVFEPEPKKGPSWREMVYRCMKQEQQLTHQELSFLSTLKRWRGTPTSKQMKWLTQIYEAVS